ncbi:MAG: isocitrate lyase/PEP mutase family protein [Hyphomicrobiaceae bacterium]|nr:isocitrate lyase/PEP mutase family protein [Hyphomicrobiaceae bacterium]
MSARPTTAAYPPGLRHTGDRNRRLAERLRESRILIAPGCFDCLGARIIETSGFEAAYISGAGVSLSQLGAPDLGLVSFSEHLDRVKRIADVLTIPVFADIDTGFGGPLSIVRTVREMERAGVSAVQIEDQEMPKRCGHELGRRVVSPAEMEGRIKAAADSRLDENFLIVARTDARTMEGIEAAIERAQRYREAGADVLFVESPESEDEMARIAKAVPGVPLLANMVEGGRTPIMPAARLEALGFRLAIYPNALTRRFAKVGLELMAALKAEGSTLGQMDGMLTHGQLWDLFDSRTWLALESEFGRRNS